MSTKTQISHYLEDRDRAVEGRGRFNILGHRVICQNSKMTLTHAIFTELK